MKYNNETALLAAIFQEANPLEPQSSVDEYLHHFAFEIDRMGRVLRFLGLATMSNECGLDWAPNHRLMRIIAEKVMRRFQAGGKIVINKEDRDFVAAIYHRATGDEKEEGSMDATDFCCDVLAFLGLLERGEGEEGGFKPTPRIKDLVLQHFLNVEGEGDEEKEKEKEKEKGLCESAFGGRVPSACLRPPRRRTCSRSSR